MNALSDISSHFLLPQSHVPRLLLVETNGRPTQGITDLFAALALHGPFYAIAGGEWLPTYALVRTLRQKTTAVHQVLGRVRLARPFTCYQVLDLLTDMPSFGSPERDPVLVLDFLHHFHNPDIQFDVRRRVLDQCCRCLERLSLSRVILLFVETLDTEEYRTFLPSVARIADEILQAAEQDAAGPLQSALF